MSTPSVEAPSGASSKWLDGVAERVKNHPVLTLLSSLGAAWLMLQQLISGLPGPVLSWRYAEDQAQIWTWVGYHDHNAIWYSNFRDQYRQLLEIEDELLKREISRSNYIPSALPSKDKVPREADLQQLQEKRHRIEQELEEVRKW